MAKQDEKKDRAKAPAHSRRFWRYVFVLALAGVVTLAWLSMLSFSPLDPPSPYIAPPQAPQNSAGIVGAYLAYYLRYWLGAGAYMAMLFATMAAVILMLGGRVSDFAWRIMGVLLLVTATSAAVYVTKPGPAQDVAAGYSGILGSAAGRFVLEEFSRIGSYIVIAITLLVGLLLAADNLVLRLPRLGRKVWDRRGEVAALVGSITPKMFKASPVPQGAAIAGAGRGTLTAGPELKRPPMPKDVKTAEKSKADDKAAAEKAAAEKAAAEKAAAEKAAAEKAAAEKAKAAERVAPLVVAKPAAAPVEAKPKAAKGGSEKFELPPTDLLAPPSGGYGEKQELHAARNKQLLQQTLTDFSVGAEVVGYQTGPVITLFELALAPGVKVAQVENLAKDIARALSVPGVRIVPPRFGKDTIGVELPNLDKETVRIKELMNMAPSADKDMRLPLYLGKDAGGNAIVTDLAGMPHLLIAGTTGSGKSVCINTIIMSLLMTRKPEDVRLILVDPKMVEMAAFENIPHLLCPIVNDMRRAEEILEWAAVKMDERYELLKEANVKNIAGFNALGKEEIYKRLEITDEQEKARIATHLPYYVIIIDELADLIMTADKEVEGHIIRIAQKARAVGIHLILATQRPSANVVTGLIRSNMPCRISFRVASRLESRIILDQNGADVLLGQGDMLFLQPGSASLTRAQGTFVADGEIRTVVDLLREKGEPQYDTELLRLDAGPVGEGGGEKDELFDQAVEVVLASQRGSVSLLQRRLQIGYSRSSRIIDQMAEAGILGDYKGSQARECNMTLEDWQAMKSSISKDQSGESAANGEPTSV